MPESDDMERNNRRARLLGAERGTVRGGGAVAAAEQLVEIGLASLALAACSDLGAQPRENIGGGFSLAGLADGTPRYEHLLKLGIAQARCLALLPAETHAFAQCGLFVLRHRAPHESCGGSRGTGPAG